MKGTPAMGSNEIGCIVRLWFVCFVSTFFLLAVNCPQQTISSGFANGTVKARSSNYQSIAIFFCSTGYHIAGEARSSIRRLLTCQHNGQWNGKRPKCSRK